jgi:hypothetical protein
MKPIFKYTITLLAGIILGLIICAKTKYFNHGCDIISVVHDTTYIRKTDTLRDTKIIKLSPEIKTDSFIGYMLEYDTTFVKIRDSFFIPRLSNCIDTNSILTIKRKLELELHSDTVLINTNTVTQVKKSGWYVGAFGSWNTFEKNVDYGIGAGYKTKNETFLYVNFKLPKSNDALPFLNRFSLNLFTPMPKFK